MRKINFKWILYELTSELKAKRNEMAKELFEFLHNCYDTKLRNVLTQDETNYFKYTNGRPNSLKTKTKK